MNIQSCKFYILNNMYPAHFKIDSLGYEVFDGFTKNESWNGWKCPYFSFEKSQKTLKIYNEFQLITGQDNIAYYDFTQDAFVFPDTESEEIYSAITDKGQKYYPIGAFAWIWEQATE